MKKLIARFMVTAALVGGAVGMAGCTGGSQPVEVSEDAVIIDVRTPEEYAEGHLEGAVLMDLNSGDFAQTMPTLDPEGEYLVYCRSGNRSGQAVSLMKDAGFTNVTDLGSFKSASKTTGIPLVTD
ncbi:rhodanese-like domain-containing protein [Actinomyces minihominis]|uniref:rhodanese-like domain-containing protein n=1 Tax=Actinomyces minihominis TaxID=2002838 RepID=UPI001A934291|nr:rhodanese-like domain-containing protein [Actinomyces minihominis]